MKANELMIGNLVCLGNRIAKVIEIAHLSCVVVDLEETQDTIEDYERTKPIPLTEEWLLKFGFEFDEICNTEDFNNRDYKLKINCDEEMYICLCMNIWQIGSDVNMCYTRNREILYVHQLQNLYFALTGEEITFKSE